MLEFRRLTRTILGLTALACTLSACTGPSKARGLKDVLGDRFLIGTCLNDSQARRTDSKADSLLLLHFNAITPENCLKSSEIQPKWGTFRWEQADRYVNYGTSHDLWTMGHCLIWHSQLTSDFCYDENHQLLDAETLKERMRTYIHTVVGRYKGRIKAWDVVNEAIMENGSYRNSEFYRILGKEFIPWAFQCAQEADPDCELYYNDYNMFHDAKISTVIEFVKDMQVRGIRIDAIGFQSHLGMDTDLAQVEKCMQRIIDETGLDVMVTEWDMSILPSQVRTADISAAQDFAGVTRNGRKGSALNPYPDGVPQAVADAWNARMGAFLDMLVRNAGHVRRVTAWGLNDACSWKNDWPIEGRTDYPLLFDRNYEAKPFIQKILNSNGKKSK